jgi:hypothetical protein
MQDRRALPRSRTLKSGIIEFNRAGGITCTVRNLSDIGAMLEVESVIGIPDEFGLFVEADKLKRDCKVAWRRSTRLGVKFL